MSGIQLQLSVGQRRHLTNKVFYSRHGMPGNNAKEMTPDYVANTSSTRAPANSTAHATDNRARASTARPHGTYASDDIDGQARPTAQSNAAFGRNTVRRTRNTRTEKHGSAERGTTRLGALNVSGRPKAGSTQKRALQPASDASTESDNTKRTSRRLGAGAKASRRFADRIAEVGNLEPERNPPERVGFEDDVAGRYVRR